MTVCILVSKVIPLLRAIFEKLEEEKKEEVNECRLTKGRFVKLNSLVRRRVRDIIL